MPAPHTRCMPRLPQLELIATSDSHIPINTAVMLIKPSSRTCARPWHTPVRSRPNQAVKPPACPCRYNLGVHTLRTARWDATLGFNRSGPPRASVRAGARARGDAPRLYDQSSGLSRRVLATRMWKRDTWDVVNGDGDQARCFSRASQRGALVLDTWHGGLLTRDTCRICVPLSPRPRWQGLLVHVFFVLLRGATFRYASPLNRFNKSASSPTWTVNHFFSGH